MTATRTEPTTARPRVPMGSLLLLALACFTAVATETLPVGLLPLMAADFGVTESRIGLLVSLYAVAVVVASVPLNAWTTRLARRPLLMVLIGVYGASNLVLALTHSYAVAAGARMLGGLTHALFFAVLFGYAVAITPKERTATAIAIVGSGSGVAIALGTPLGTLLATVIGWRQTFLVVAGLAALMVLITWLRLPALPGSEVGGGTQLREVLGQPAFRWLEVATVAMMAGVFAAYTYLSPIMISYGFAVEHVGIALLGFGLASITSRLVFGGLGDRHLRPAFLSSLALLTVVSVAITLLPHTLVAGIVLVVVWGIAFGPLSSFLQVAIVRAATGHTETAAAVHNAVFNIGIAGGAFVGAQLLLVTETTTVGVVAAALVAVSIPIVGYWLSARRAVGTAR